MYLSVKYTNMSLLYKTNETQSLHDIFNIDIH